MERIDIIKQLMHGNHLSEEELKEARKLLRMLNLELKLRKKRK